LPPWKSQHHSRGRNSAEQRIKGSLRHRVGITCDLLDMTVGRVVGQRADVFSQFRVDSEPGNNQQQSGPANGIDTGLCGLPVRDGFYEPLNELVYCIG